MIATLFLGASTFFLTRFLYTYYVKPSKEENPFNDLALAISIGTLGLLLKVGEQKKSKEKESTTEYGGIILNPNEVRATCHCEPVCRVACFGKGAVGTLSKEQVEKYCPHKYEQLKKMLEKERVNWGETPKLELPQGIKQ